MAGWNDLETEAPETAAVADRRLRTTGLGLLATLRADGFPRISPLEPLIHDGLLWLGMMPGSAKSRDLRRDPRCCLHTATADKDVTDGDAKLWGVALAVEDPSQRSNYAAAVRGDTGVDVEAMPSGFDLWVLDLTGGSSLVLGEGRDHLRITAWTPGTPERVIKRY